MDLIDGAEMALLQDGAIYGPRYGYRLERGPTNKQYDHAILVTLNYPPAEAIPVNVKILMIFQFFNAVGDDYMDAEEFEVFCTTLQKDSWRQGELSFKELCANFAKDWNVRIDYKKGIHLRDLLKLYRNEDELDKDFQALFPPGGHIGGLSTVDDFSSFDGDSDNDSVSESSDSESLSEDDMGVYDLEAAHGQAFVKKVLQQSSNARKLMRIFEHATQQSRGRVAEDLLADVPFVASKILETHLTMYATIFGREPIVGMNDRLAVGDEYFDKVARLTTLIKIVHMELQSEIEQTFQSCFASMFESTVVGQGVIQFMDYVWPSEIGAKALRLVNDRINVAPVEVDESNAVDIATCYPPKTAYQVMAFVFDYQVANCRLIADQLELGFSVAAASSIGVDMKIYVAVVTKILVEAGVLYMHDVWEELVPVPPKKGQRASDVPKIHVKGIEKKCVLLGGTNKNRCIAPGVHVIDGVRTRIIRVVLPRNRECYRLIARTVEQHVSMGVIGDSATIQRTTGRRQCRQHY